MPNNPRRSTLKHLVRVCLFSLLAAAAISEVLPLIFSSTAIIVRANGKSNATPGLTPSYQWNLRDQTKPLIDFPEHIGGNLGVALTYSLDQFQLPLFQTLYFNESARKYILMVFAKESRRAEFIELSQAGKAQFVSNEKLNLRLRDGGAVKILSAADGTRYVFSRLADGEFHCRRIEDAGGVVIMLGYSDKALLNNITDPSGRKIDFTYSDEHVTAIMQTWNLQVARMTRTWAVSSHELLHSKSSGSPLGPLVAKRIPSNAMTPNYTADMVVSDATLAAVFGGPGAVGAANGFEPRKLGNQYPLYRGNIVGDDGRTRRGHLSYAMHLYGSEDGSAETDLYVPAGFTSHSAQPSPTDAAVTFYYPQLGNLTNVTLAVFHILNFGIVPEGKRVRIGKIGGPGGSVDSYKHSHIEFYRGHTGLPRSSARARLRIDPAGVFGTNYETVARAK